MINLFNKKDKLANNKLCSVLRKWNSLAKLLNYNDKAIKIQKQWNKYQDKLNKDKELANKLKIQRGLEKLINNKFGGKYAINKIKEEANRNKFNKFINVLINNRKNKLKDSLDKIKKQAFDNTLKKALEVQPIFKNRIIKNSLLKLKDKTDKLAKKRAVEKINKNWKIYLKNKKEKNKAGLLKDILTKLNEKNLNKRSKYMNIWLNIAKKIRDIDNKRKIANYFKNRYKISNSRNIWNN